jgi:hypothetical protein
MRPESRDLFLGRRRICWGKEVLRAKPNESEKEAAAQRSDKNKQQ